MERGQADPGPPGSESLGGGTIEPTPIPATPGASAVGTPTASAPVEATNDGLIGRRRFIRLVVGCSIVSLSPLVITPVVGFLIPRKTEGAGGGGRVLAGTTTDIPPGSGKVVAMGSSPVIVVNAESGVKAFSAVCTHLGCIVGYDSTAKAIICPCHDGRFNPATGAVVSGPPPAPLKPISVAVEKDQIYLVEG